MKNPEICLALLDANGAVVAQTVEGFITDWKRPFVATEVGEILPHWEVAAYLLNPGSVTASARSARIVRRRSSSSSSTGRRSRCRGRQ